jgi:hypothetical protein
MDFSRPLGVVTPTVDGDVLAALALVDASFTPGQLHRLLGRHSEAGVRKVLMRLASQGIVVTGRVGNAFHYGLNRQHLAAEPITALAQQRETFLQRVENLLEGWSKPPIYGAVFGSAARGGMRSDSDIDILLVRPPAVADDLWAEQVAALTAAVWTWTGNDARVLEFSEKELRGEPEPVVAAVRDHGLTVAGSSDWLRSRTRGRRGAH